MNKRGVSAMVATVLIILILTAAIAVVWVSILGIASNIEFDDIEPRVEIVISKGYTVCDDDDRVLLVQVRRGDDAEQIDRINLIVNFEGNTEKWTVNAPEPNSIITHNISIVNSPGCFESASVSPLFVNPNGKETEGRITSEVDIPQKNIANIPEGLLDPEDLVDGGRGGSGGCELISASWDSPLTIDDGDVAGMTVIGNNCGSETFNYTIWESDFGSDDYTDSFISSSLLPSWTSFWTYDGNPAWSSEYYFSISVVSDPSEIIDSGELNPELLNVKVPACVSVPEVAPLCNDLIDNDCDGDIDYDDVDCGLMYVLQNTTGTLDGGNNISNFTVGMKFKLANSSINTSIVRFCKNAGAEDRLIELYNKNRVLILSEVVSGPSGDWVCKDLVTPYNLPMIDTDPYYLVTYFNVGNFGNQNWTRSFPKTASNIKVQNGVYIEGDNFAPLITINDDFNNVEGTIDFGVVVYP